MATRHHGAAPTGNRPGDDRTDLGDEMPHHLLSELVRLHNCEIRRDASRRALVRALRRRGMPSH